MFDLLAVRRPLLLALATAVVLLILFVLPGGPARGLTSLPLHDFVEYWAAGRLNAGGENPYDPERIHDLEREAGRDGEGILMWNPPWTLPLVMPLGRLDCRTAHLLWLALQFAAVAVCADVLWRLYGGAAERRWIAWLLAFAFVPTLISLTAGQISPLVLLGVVLFLAALRQGRDGLAGAATVLVAIKPHLAYLFWLALLLWCIRQRRWAILGGGLLAGLLALAAAVACNPSVLAQYAHTFTNRPPAQYRSPTLGTALRLLLSDERFSLQFVALVPGLLWFAVYWPRRRAGWRWDEQLPLLLLVSLLTAPYGAWPFDLVLLLVPVVQIAAGIERSRWLPAVTIFAVLNGLAAAQLVAGVEYLGFIWMTPALLLAYLVLRRAPAPVIRLDCP